MSYKFQMTWTMKVYGKHLIIAYDYNVKSGASPIPIYGPPGYEYTIKSPLTVQFNVYRKTEGNVNTSNFKIYNLKKSIRDDLLRDPAKDALEPLRPLIFQAGYASKGYESVCFEGEVYRCFSYREGPDIITEIESHNGCTAVRRAQVEQTYGKGTSPEMIFRSLVGTMNKYGVFLGALGRLAGTVSPVLVTSIRGAVFAGSSWKIIKKIIGSQGYACIDRSKVYIMAEDECIFKPGNIQKIDSSVGLLGTPRRSDSFIDFDMIFEPNLDAMQSLEVFSTVNPDVNGVGIIRCITHHGIISDGVQSSVTTSVGLTEDGIRNPKRNPKVVKTE